MTVEPATQQQFAQLSKQIDEQQKLQRQDHDLSVRLDTKLDMYIQEARQSGTTVTGMLTDHETRIGKLERRDEVSDGILAQKKMSKRAVFEAIGVATAIITAVGTWLLAHPR